MSYRQVEQTTETTTAESKQAPAEKDNVVRRDTAVSTLASAGGDPNTQAANLHHQTGGNLSHAGHTLLQLQNQFGNRYVQQLINPQQRLTVQPKLMLGDVDTPSEREADRIAGQAVSSSKVTGMPTAVSGAMTPVAPETESAINLAKGGGQPLPESTRSQMEQSLGTDFSSVRIHTDSQAHHLNQSLQAKAFTTGQDIFFRQGAYSPGSSGGQTLIAHELTHVVQQNSEAALQPGSPLLQRTIYNEASEQWQVKGLSYSQVVKELERRRIKESPRLQKIIMNYLRSDEQVSIQDLLEEFASQKKTSQERFRVEQQKKQQKNVNNEEVIASKEIKRSLKEEWSNLNIYIDRFSNVKVSAKWTTDKLRETIPDSMILSLLEEASSKEEVIYLEDLYAAGFRQMSEKGINYYPRLQKRKKKRQAKNEKAPKKKINEESLKQLEIEVEEAAEESDPAQEKRNKYWQAFTNWIKKNFRAFGEWLAMTYGGGGVEGAFNVLWKGSWEFLKGIIKLAWWALKTVGKSLMKPLVVFYNAFWDKKDFFKDVKSLLKERKNHTWNTTYEALVLMIEETRDWTGWISVITALLGVIPVPGMQALLGVSAIAGSINVLAGFIAAPLRGLHTLVLQTRKYLNKRVDPTIWQRSKEKSLGATIAILTTGFTNAVTGLAGGGKGGFGGQFEAATDLKANIENVGKIDSAVKDALGKGPKGHIDTLKGLGGDGGRIGGGKSSDISVDEYLSMNAPKQSTYAIADANFGEIGDLSAQAGTAIGIAMAPIKLVAKIIAGGIRGVSWLIKTFSRKPQVPNPVNQKFDEKSANSEISRTMEHTNTDLHGSLAQLREIESEMEEVSQHARESKKKLKKH